MTSKCRERKILEMRANQILRSSRKKANKKPKLSRKNEKEFNPTDCLLEIIYYSAE